MIKWRSPSALVAESAGDVIATAVYALANEMTVRQMAELWCPYLTMAEGLKLAAQSFTREVSILSCCASRPGNDTQGTTS